MDTRLHANREKLAKQNERREADARKRKVKAIGAGVAVVAGSAAGVVAVAAAVAAVAAAFAATAGGGITVPSAEAVIGQERSGGDYALRLARWSSWPPTCWR